MYDENSRIVDVTENVDGRTNMGFENNDTRRNREFIVTTGVRTILNNTFGARILRTRKPIDAINCRLDVPLPVKQIIFERVTFERK